jgi:hypothetical protein
MNVTLKQAVQSAFEFARDVLVEPSDDYADQRTKMIRLEEVDAGKTGEAEVWVITLSLPDPDVIVPAQFGQRRIYKTFTVDGTTGRVLSMKIRELAGVE